MTDVLERAREKHIDRMATLSNYCFDSINMIQYYCAPAMFDKYSRYLRCFDSRNGYTFGDLLGPPSPLSVPDGGVLGVR